MRSGWAEKYKRDLKKKNAEWSLTQRLRACPGNTHLLNWSNFSEQREHLRGLQIRKRDFGCPLIHSSGFSGCVSEKCPWTRRRVCRKKKKRLWLPRVPKCWGVFYIHVLRNDIPHDLSLIQLAPEWKLPSPCMHCEKFLGFVSWMFHGKRNSVCVVGGVFFFNWSFEMSWTCFENLIGLVFRSVASHPSVLSSKPRILQPLARSVPWFDNPAFGGWSGRRGLIPLFFWFSQHAGGLLGCPTSSLWKIVRPI